jgi:hypothetical protein
MFDYLKLKQSGPLEVKAMRYFLLNSPLAECPLLAESGRSVYSNLGSKLNMKHQLSKTDNEFKDQFETCVLPPSEFDHRAHIRLAYVYLVENDDDMACQLMRDSLLNFLNHNGVELSKFYETMTRAWILAVRHFMEKDSGAESANSFIENNPKMLDKNIMMTHYSAELLLSDKAREHFVAPDLDPIPRYEK